MSSFNCFLQRCRQSRFLAVIRFNQPFVWTQPQRSNVITPCRGVWNLRQLKTKDAVKMPAGVFQFRAGLTSRKTVAEKYSRHTPSVQLRIRTPSASINTGLVTIAFIVPLTVEMVTQSPILSLPFSTAPGRYCDPGWDCIHPR